MKLRPGAAACGVKRSVGPAGAGSILAIARDYPHFE
jgi:hypothetical protein